MNNDKERKYANVAVDLPVFNNKTNYFYTIPEELNDSIKIGSVVHVPFGKQELNAFVLDVLEKVPSEIKDIKLKEIYNLQFKNPIWDSNFLKLAEWISEYYLTNIGTVLSASVSSEMFDNYTSYVLLNEHLLNANDLSNFSKEQKIILEKLLNSKNKALSYTALKQKLKITKQKFYQIINQLKNKGIIEINLVRKESKPKKIKKNTWSFIPAVKKTYKQIILNEDQENAFNRIYKEIEKEHHEVFLLHGVTGSGKTEVYLRLIEEALKKNKKVIYLVPEIYLIPQIYERLSLRFDPSSIVIWHSLLSKNQVASNCANIFNNEDENKIKIILGARSAILSPIKNIGLIVIDEAHDASYKQSSPAPRYDAIKVSIKRGEIEKCPIVLGTATPQIDIYHEMKKKETILSLPNRVKNISMPFVCIVDMKKEFPKFHRHIVSNILRSNIELALSKKEQVILLLNRRGYANNVFCKACGYTLLCKQCSVPMIYHKNLSSTVCHHCGFMKPYSPAKSFCHECNSPHVDSYGIGTEQLEEEIKKIFPSSKTVRVDRDQLRKKDEYIKLWDEFSSHRADILIGTQLVAKGIDLPNVTVVGVISADLMLNFPDYVSYERAFQLITQVTGRAGRGEKPGKVFIQTYRADDRIFNHIKDHSYENFYKEEIIHREEHCYPPFVKLIRIIFQSLSEKDCLDYATKISDELSKRFSNPESALLGPAPCYLSKLHNKFRYHLLCKISDANANEAFVSSLIKDLYKNPNVEIIVDVDSVNLL